MTLSPLNQVGSLPGKGMISEHVSKNLETVLLQQFLSIMTEGGEQNEFTGGTAEAQFKSFLNEYYASILSEKRLFNLDI